MPLFPQAPAAETEKAASLQELQPLVQSLNRKVEEWEERCALLQEQAEGLKALLQSEQERYSQKESMYEKDVGDVAVGPAPGCCSASSRTRPQTSSSSSSSSSRFQIQTFKDIILQKEEQLTQANQLHEQELFKLAAKSDASADLEQVTPGDDAKNHKSKHQTHL